MATEALGALATTYDDGWVDRVRELAVAEVNVGLDVAGAGVVPQLIELTGDPARVAENVADAGDTAFTGPLGDYVQAYSALGSPDAASAAATAFAARTTFDDGWSKSLALAWVAAVQARSG